MNLSLNDFESVKQDYENSNRTAVLLEMSRTNDHIVTLKANLSAFQAVNFSMAYQDYLIRESDTVKMLFGLSLDNKTENAKAEISGKSRPMFMMTTS